MSSALRDVCKWTESCQVAIDSLANLANLSTFIEAEYAARGREVWKDEILLGLRVNSVAYSLLESLPGDSFEMPNQAAFEALRLGMRVWIIVVKQKSQAYPGPTTTYVARLLRLLEDSDVKHPMMTQPSLVVLHLWLLMIVMSTVPLSDERHITRKLIAEDMVQLGIGSWKEVMTTVRLLPWIGDLEPSLQLLGGN